MYRRRTARLRADCQLAFAFVVACCACTEPYDPSGRTSSPTVIAAGSNGALTPTAGAGGASPGRVTGFGGTTESPRPTPATGSGGNPASAGTSGSTTMSAGSSAAAAGSPSGGPNANAGSGASAGASGSAGSQAGTSAGPDGAAHPDLGKGDGKDVVTIGDSYMQLSAGTAVEPSLERAAGNDYRNYAQQGTRLIGGTNPIPGQYARAVSENPKILTVVMTGGGNDIIQESTLFSACSQMMPTQQCIDALPPLLDALSTLWAKMAKDGVQDVFYLTYPRAPAGNTIAGGVRNLAPVFNPMIKSKCDAVPAPLHCHMLIGDDAFKTTAFELRADGIHPTDAGYAILGTFVYNAMVAAGARR